MNLNTFLSSDSHFGRVRNHLNLVDRCFSNYLLFFVFLPVIVNVLHIPYQDFALISGASHEKLFIVCDRNRVNRHLVLIKSCNKCSMRFPLPNSISVRFRSKFIAMCISYLDSYHIIFLNQAVKLIQLTWVSSPLS
jgi:hypothetical protein